MLIFKDSGRKENRFEPPVTVNEDDSEFKKMYVDVKTGEEFTPTKVEPVENEIETEIVVERIRKPLFDMETPQLSHSSSSSASSAMSSPVPVKVEDVTEEAEAFAMKEEPVDGESKAGEDEDAKAVDEIKDEDFLEDEEEVEYKEEEEDFKEEDLLEEDEEVDDEVDGEDDEEPELTAEFEDDSTINEELIEETVELNADAHAELDSDAELEAEKSETEASDKSEDGDAVADETTIDPEEELLECEKPIDGDEESTAFTDGTKTLTDDSDSEDSDSSSSSSCSSSSCSSSDTTDDEDKEVDKPEPVPPGQPVAAATLEESEQD